MKADWLDHCLALAEKKETLYSGCRKIIRNQSLTFDLPFDIALEDAGYTKAKMAYLERAYLHSESLQVATQLWLRRREQQKYGSVGVTCYNHFIKNDPAKKSKRASVMGPCIQSYTLTLTKKNTVAIDVFYRTTELFKKFPADLVFLKNSLLNFDFTGFTTQDVTCHFANITLHPMYFVTILPHLPNPLASLERLKSRDKYFFDWVIKWTARYTHPDYHRGIAKFAQAQRVQKDALNRIQNLQELNSYLIKNHPGHRNEYNEDLENDDDC